MKVHTIGDGTATNTPRSVIASLKRFIVGLQSSVQLISRGNIDLSMDRPFTAALSRWGKLLAIQPRLLKSSEKDL